eukprot:TRINITY_DN12106_c0_g1_i4.p1 TRINITY_DN12106_c0_g1~~TRINITY_DN12106_c0_g1_i4.p1  ORF type:complete len:563 (+),score=114.64 TRINITY_DN12106_c0_g1_i4:50-1690(+)
MAKRFINDKATIVHEAIDGLIASTPNLTRLDGFPDTKVVLRSDWDKNAGKVSVICGGGSGHEPSFAGFVGSGFLTAAVCGNVFASPSQEAVLAAIVATTGPAGCLLVCMNYTGDRFCFGIAAARAKNEYGLDVKLLVISDDVAIPDAKQPRGLAGTLFVLKVAGAAASAGLSLEKVEAEAAAVSANVRSFGVSFSTCTLPGAEKQERMNADEMEVGLGIHGEPGFKKMKLGSANEVADIMVEQVMKSMSATDEVALMVGNLGSVPPMEMTLMTNALLKRIKAKLLVGPAPLMTSLDMNGVQISILKLCPGMEDRLLATTSSRAWPSAITPNTPKLVPMPLKEPEVEKSPVPDADIEAIIKKVCDALISATAELNELDGKVGDGDCGNTMKTGAESILAALPKVSTSNPRATFTAIGRALNSLGGSSGVLLSVMFTTMAGSIKEDTAWSREGIGPAFAEGVATMMRVGGAEPGMRTMIDVLLPVSEALLAGKSNGEICAIAKEKADATAQITSTNFGRSQYLNEESLAGTKDPGCAAAALAIGAIAS